MQLISNKKELLEIDRLCCPLTFYHRQPKILSKIFCQFSKKHTFAAEKIFILSKP